MQNSIIRYSIILSGIAILLFPQWVAAETWYVKKSRTKLQAEASARSKVIGKLRKGTPVEVNKKSGRFFQVSTSSKTGWIFRFKLTKKAPSSSGGGGDVLGTLGGDQRMATRESRSGSSIRGLSPISEEHARKKGATRENIQAVKDMESFEVRPEEMDQFLEEGKLGEYIQ
jgi:uncharacterized protein YgiM (DUF1202 family)